MTKKGKLELHLLTAPFHLTLVLVHYNYLRLSALPWALIQHLTLSPTPSSDYNYNQSKQHKLSKVQMHLLYAPTGRRELARVAPRAIGSGRGTLHGSNHNNRIVD